MKLTRWALAIPTFVLTALAAVAPAQENAWTSHGPTDVGWVNDLAIADSVAYAATLNGVFRSSDGGVSWQQSGLEGQSIAQIVARSGAAVVLARASGTLYASRDGARFWAPVPGLPPVYAAAIDPRHLSTIYAGASDGTIWKSTDAGASVRVLSSTPTGHGVLAFEFDARAVYMTTFDDSDNTYRPYRSLDGGVSWAPVSYPIPNVTIGSGALSGVVYAWGQGSFCRSIDSAATWTCSNFPGYPTHVVEVPGQDPGAPPRILAASILGVYASDDRGAVWARVNGDLGSNGNLTALAAGASGPLVLAGTASGVFRSQDRGDSWTLASSGLHSSIIAALALDPQDPSTVWAGSSNTGLFRSADAGFSWSPAGGPVGPVSIGAIAIDPQHPATLYASGPGVYRSDDGGTHWTSSALPGGDSAGALAVDPGSPERVWAASGAPQDWRPSYSYGLLRSDDGALSFQRAPAVAQQIFCILFDAKRAGTVYAGSYFDVEPGSYGYPFGGSIFVSRDSGVNWIKSEHDIGSAVLAIATDPFHDGSLYAGTTAGVFRSADNGVTWQGPGPGLPASDSTIRSLVADPVRSGRLYAATSSGVYRTIDGAQTWQAFSSGLGSLHVQPLAISPDGRWLHAGTDGGGVFELDLETSPTCSPTETRLCLVGNRYAVELLAGRRGEVPNNPGAAQNLSDRSGYFGLPFATGDPTFPEVVVKMLADGAFGVDGAPIFYSSLTTLPYVLTVTDKVTGQVKVYAGDSDAPLCGATDLFGTSSPWDYSMRLLSAPAAAGETALELLDGRFSVTLEARHPASGRTATGTVMSSADRFGIFSLPGFTGDSQFPEVVVKMVDFRSITGQFWFFYTGLTNLDYTLTVTDSATGAVRTYASATPYCGGADIRAFTD